MKIVLSTALILGRKVECIGDIKVGRILLILWDKILAIIL